MIQSWRLSNGAHSQLLFFAQWTKNRDNESTFTCSTIFGLAKITRCASLAVRPCNTVKQWIMNAIPSNNKGYKIYPNYDLLKVKYLLSTCTIHSLSFPTSCPEGGIRERWGANREGILVTRGRILIGCSFIFRQTEGWEWVHGAPCV